MQDNSGMSDVRLLEYLDFELEIGSGRGREYPVAVLHSPAGEVQEIMQFPFDDRGLESQLKGLQIALLRSGGQRRVVTSPEEKSVQNFGRALFDALLVRDVHTLYEVSRREALGQGKGLRVKLRIEPPELAMLPWEFLYDSDQVEYVCLSRITPVVRYLELPQSIQPLSVVPPLRILGMVACPSDLPKLDVTREKGWVEEAIRDLHANGLVKLTWLEGHTWRDLQQAMRRGPWHIFHFVGHGGFDRNADEGFIALADESGKTHRLKATLLGRLLADHASLRLVLLNACEGARGSERDLFSSTAAILVQRGIPAVLAMQYEITDQAALEFARSFYGALADSLPVDAAVAEARKAVSFAVNNTVEWGTPALYMRSPDGVLFHIQDRAKTDGVQEGTKPEVSHEAQKVSAEGTKEAPEQKVTEAPSIPQGTEDVHEVPSGSQGTGDVHEVPSGPQDVPSEQVERLYDRGMKCFQSQSWEKAVEALGKLVQIAPWYKGAGQLYLEVKDRARETEEFERKKAHKSEYTEDLYRMGKVCYEKAQWESAAYYLGRIVESGEEHNDTVVLLNEAKKQLRLRTLRTEVAACFRESKWTKATEALEAILSIDPTDEEAKAQLDQAREQHRLQTLYEEASGHLRGERWLPAVKILETIRDYLDAADKLEEAQKQQDLATLYIDAVGAQETHQWRRAIDKFHEIVRKAGVHKDVARRLDQVQGQLQQELVVRFNRGERYLRQRRWKEAAAEFERVNVLDPDYRSVRARLQEVNVHLHPEELRRRGEASLRVGNWREAVEIFEELRKSDPTDESVAARLEEAKERLELDRLYRKGVEYLRKGKWGRASGTFERVIGLNPDYRDAAAKRKVAQERLGQSSPLVRFLTSPVLAAFANVAQVIAFTVAAVPVVIGLAIAVSRIAGSVVATPTPRPPTLCNGSFDNGPECWEHGGELKQSVKCEGAQCYAVLGSPDYKCEGEVPMGEAWIRQPFQVPQTISPTLSLRYRVFSHDVYVNDSFRVQINDDLVGQFGNRLWSVPSCDREPWDSGWQTVEFDLSRYKGQNVEVLLSNVNGNYEWWNTLTHVDDVQVH